MTTKLSVFIATSLDGYIAREDGRIDWLEQANQTFPPGEDCGYAAFMATVDGLVMGRNTFELVQTFDTWPYPNTPVVVLSRSGVKLPDALSDRVSVSQESPQELVARLSAQGATHLYVDGGQTIQSFLREGLIDEITISVIPVLIGTGRSLFGPLCQDIPLTHLATKVYGFGVVQHIYRVAKSL